MWEVLVRTPLGRLPRRKFSHVFASFIVALFGYMLASAPTAAAADANWDGDNLVYDTRTYQRVDSDPSFPSDVKNSPAIYRSTDNTVTPNLVHFVYFSNANAFPEKEASYIRYTLNPPNRYINPTPAIARVITVEPNPNVEQADNEDGALSNQCTIDGIGWMVCPLMQAISESLDFVYAAIRGFLVVQPITTSVDNPIYRVWNYSRDLANIAFAIGFLVIIYSYLVGGGFNGYEIRKILPRLVLAAILINLSYIICAVAVDLSNIAGSSVNQLFENVRDGALDGSRTSAGVNWVSVTTFVLAGGGAAAAAALTLPAIVGGAAGLWLLLLTPLFGAALIVIVTFLILAARQAIIIVLIAIAPLAFAAFILPNTEKWFEKWRSLFFTMLIMFPAFGAVFGGAQLAGDVIIRSATSIEQIILGLGVMIAPLAITPLLLKLGGGVLNRFGGIVNNPQKGLYDRFKNRNNERRADHLAQWQADNAAMRRNGTFSKKQLWRRSAARSYAMKNHREGMRKLDEERGHNEWHAQHGRWGGDNHNARDGVKSRFTGRPKEGYGNLDTYKRDNKLAHDLHESHHERHWNELLQGDSRRRAMQTETRINSEFAKIAEAEMADSDSAFISQNIANNATGNYAKARTSKVSSVVQKGLAENANKLVEANGSALLAETVLSTQSLKNQVIKTQEYQGRANQANELIEDAAKANWEKLSLEDRTIYSRQLERQGNAKQLKAYQAEWDSILSEAASGRVDDYNAKFGPMTSDVARSINVIEQADQSIAVEEYRKARAEYVGKVDLYKNLKADDSLLRRAAGIDEAGRIKVMSELSKAGSTLHMQNVEAIESVMSNEGYQLEEQKLILQGKAVRGGNPPTDMERHAAMRRILLTNGNNWAAQEVYDYVISQGLRYDASANNGEGAYYDENDVEITDQNEVSSRRDLQQIWIDAQSKSGLKVDYLSGTQRGLAEAGLLQRQDKSRTASEQAIINDINQAKIKGERITGADIDIIDRQIQVFSDPSSIGLLDDAQKLKYVETLNRTLADPMLGGRMSEREWSHTKILANMLDESDTRPLDEKMRFYTNRDGVTKEIQPVKNNYNYIR